MRLRLEIVPETEREASLMKQLIDFEPYYDAVAEQIKQIFAFQLGRVVVLSRDNIHDVPETSIEFFRITEVGGD